MNRRLAIGLVSLLAAPSFSVSLDPLVETAQYYYSKQEYAQSLKLWTEAYHKKPRDLARLYKVAEISLLVEGRAASRERLRDFLKESFESLSPEEKKSFKTHYSSLQNVFISEEGQANFLQARAKLSRNDLSGALLHLNQANSLETDHPQILLTKAETERHLSEFRAAYESLQAGYLADPFHSEIREWLAEAHLFYHQPEKAIDVLEKYDETAQTARQKTALAVAFSETGKVDESTRILKSLAEREKQWGLHPIVYFTLGRNSKNPKESRLWLERFINLASNPEPSDSPVWDPYQITEKLEIARKLLKS